MRNISSSDAFLILGKWRDKKSQLQISFAGRGQLAGTPAVVIETSPQEETLSASIVASGQAAVWRCNLRGASFQYGEASDSAVFPEFAEGKWVSYLLAELPEGKTILFAERFLEEEDFPVDTDIAPR
jgi:hypothetical protein